MGLGEHATGIPGTVARQGSRGEAGGVEDESHPQGGIDDVLEDRISKYRLAQMRRPA